MAGMTPIWIDETRTLRKTNKTAFWSWQEMLEELHDHRIVFLDGAGDIELKDFEHPEDNVIYCVGSDPDGFGDLDMTDKETVRLPIQGKWHGFTVVPIIAAARMFG